MSAEGPSQKSTPAQESATTSSAGPAAGGVTQAAKDEPPTLPSLPKDEQSGSWGDDSGRGYSDEWYESQRPPHHG